MEKHIIVVGAGAAGLTAAVFAARGGANVTVLEGMDRPGKKLLMTGNGRCNLTNMAPDLPGGYRGGGGELAASVIPRFDAASTRGFFEELGLLTMEKNGYVYPLTGQASSVLEALLGELSRLNVKLKLGEKIVKVERQASQGGASGSWLARTSAWQYQADCLILCCGSKCFPATGSDGSGYELAKRLGLSVKPAAPALAPLICQGSFLPALAGVRCPAEIALYPDGERDRSIPSEPICRETGELQWTKYGISGIAVFQLSRFVSTAEPGQKFRVSIDFFPGYGTDFLLRLLARRGGELGKTPVPVLLKGLLNEKLIPVLLAQSNISRKKRCDQLTSQDLSRLLQACRRFPLKVTGTKSFDTCQVCAGGVDAGQINPDTMECKTLPGLYLAGELLDVDGPCGGYNLQWAWSSGFLAGTSAAS